MDLPPGSGSVSEDWADKIDTTLGVGDGKLTDLTTCTTTNISKTVWAWDPVHSDGYIDNVDSDGIDATMRYLDLRSGVVPATPPVIQKDAAVIYSIPDPRYSMVIYTVNKAAVSTDGVWVYQKLPWNGAATDGGTTSD